MFDTVIRCLSELFAPTVAEKWQQIWCVVNLFVCAATLFSTFAVYTRVYGGSFRACFPKIKKQQTIPQNAAADKKQKQAMQRGAVTTGILTLLWLFFHYYLETPDTSFPMHDLLHPFVLWLDTVLDFEGLLSVPTPVCPWLGILCRHAYILLIVFGIEKIGYAAGVITQQFVEYLEKTFNSTNIDSAMGSKFVKRVLTWSTVLLGVSGVSTAVSESEGLIDFSKNFLDGLMEILGKITLIAKLPEDPATLGELAYAFLLTFLSIGMIMVYATIIAIFFSFIAVIWEKKDKFPEWFNAHVVPHLKAIGWAVLALVVLSLVVMLCVNLDAVVQVAVNFIQNSPTTLLALVQQIVLLTLGVCVAILMGTFVIAFWKFACTFVKNWKNKLASIKTNSTTSGKIIRIFGAIIIMLVLLVAFVWSYDFLHDWMVARFLDAQNGYGTWWLVGQCCSLLFATAFLAVGLVLTAAMCLSAFFEIVHFFFPTSNSGGKLSVFITRVVKLISDTFLTLLTVIESFVDTILRIFVGYKTESQKNNAMFVAACFASLASLLNTFLGLYNFNHSDKIIVPTITSLAISFSVQLAMLISGMKAGQGMAESIVNDAKLVGSGKRKAIFQKQFICVLYWLVLVGVLVGAGLLAEQTAQPLASTGILWLLVVLLCTFFYIWGVMKQKLLLVYLPVGALFACFLLSSDLPVAVSSLIPMLLTSLAALAFVYGITTQILDIETIKAIKDDGTTSPPTGQKPRPPKPRKRNKPVPAPGMDMSQLVFSKPRRIPARYHFMIYILLMIVSTGFAFNNLFGCYADQTQLQDQVYQQIRTHAENAVDEKVQQIVQIYNQNNATLEDLLSKRITWLDERDSNNQTQLEKDIPLKDTPGYNENEYNTRKDDETYYKAKVRDNQTLSAGIKSYLSQDPAAYEDITKLTVYTYQHFRSNWKYPVYTTYAFEFAYQGTQTTVLGTKYTGTTPAKVISGNDTFEFSDRINDPDSTNQSILTTTLVLNNTPGKYRVVNEMLNVLESIESTVHNTQGKAVIAESVSADELNATASEMRGLLTANEALDAVLESMFGMYKTATNASDTSAGSMYQLPVYVNQYLAVQTNAPKDPTSGTTPGNSGDSADNMDPPEDAGADLKNKAFNELEQYITRAIEVYTLLSTVSTDDSIDPTSTTLSAKTHPGGTTSAKKQLGGIAPTKTRPSGTTTTNLSEPVVEADHTIALLREYLNYARGIKNSDFQLSYDTLLRGGFGMNSTLAYTGQKIDALYRAQAIACFILLICMLVDFMAFFSGLLLFQEAFLLDMENRDKLVKLGYINFDAVLTNYFTPCAETGEERKYDLSLIYYLLYSRTARNADGQLDVDDVLVSRLPVDADRLKAMIQKAQDFLDEYGVSADDPDFHVWMKSFIQKSAVTFQELKL